MIPVDAAMYRVVYDAVDRAVDDAVYRVVYNAVDRAVHDAVEVMP